MKENKSYTGIDYFRLIAALLIIAIHTSPLASYSETGDFILTRVIARLGVPFFFVTSGFFLISRYAYDTKKLRAFVKKTALIYGAAILLYIPINIYNGYFTMDNLLPNIIKDIVFDGTLYHLWYLPASILGAAIAWYLVRKLNYPKAFAAASLLYLIGLLGDSYYGIAERIPGLSGFYELIFQISDHTRNGIFLAPVYFLLGGFIADRRKDLTCKTSILGFAVSFGLMFAEAMLLRHFGVQRHDSMYVFLLPAAYFLFHWLLHFRGKRRAGLSTVCLIIYIIHPMVIVAIRLFAKLLHLQALLIDNSIVHYLAVCTASVAGGAVITILWNRFIRKKAKQSASAPRAYLEVDLSNLAHNAKVLQEAMPPKCKLMAVVKAEAYGHGMNETAAHLNRTGVRVFAVATIDEGIALRRSGISGEILILGYTVPTRAKELHKYDLIQTLVDQAHALALEQQGYHIKAHIKIDTGMHRLGYDAADLAAVMEAFSLKHVHVEGIYTHFCVSDSLADEDIQFTNLQIDAFQKLLQALSAAGIRLPKIHTQSSYGLLNYPGLEYDYARIGIALYGVFSAKGDVVKLCPPLLPVLSLKAGVASVRTIAKGETAGYGRAFTAQRDTKIAVISIGYADGVPRNLSSGNGSVLLNGQKAPIVGRICMDQLTVDATDIPDVRPGMTATLIGRDGDQEITVTDVADAAGTITNEILSRLGHRLTIRSI